MNRTGQIYRARGGRVHPHAVTYTSGIEPESDRLGRRAPRKLTRGQVEQRGQVAQEKAEDVARAPSRTIR